MALGVLTLVGWAFDVGILKAAFPGLVSMKPNTALCFLMAGLSLALQAPEARSLWRTSLARLAAGVVFLTASLTLWEYLFGLSLGLDQTFLPPNAAQEGGNFPGRLQ